jgi:anti-sigma factor RsiW
LGGDPTMAELNPELLMAYADGELDAEEKAEIEALMAHDPKARAMVERFLESGDLLRRGFDEILNLPPPQHLIDTIRKHQPAPEIVPLNPPKRNVSVSEWPRLAIAACVALIVGVVVGAGLLRGPEIEQRRETANLLQDTLEFQPTGAVLASAARSETVTPIVTFRAADGRICREFERQTRTQQTVGIACRNADGQWIAVVEIDRMLLAADQSGELDYRPASGSPDPLAAALSALGAGRALTAAEEQVLRTQGWQ